MGGEDGGVGGFPVPEGAAVSAAEVAESVALLDPALDESVGLLGSSGADVVLGAGASAAPTSPDGPFGWHCWLRILLTSLMADLRASKS